MTGTELTCDRDILVKCIFECFGSIENFDQEVQSKVRSALAKGRQGPWEGIYAIPMEAAIALLWTGCHCWSAAWRGEHGVAIYALTLYALGLSLGIVPVVLP